MVPLGDFLGEYILEVYSGDEKRNKAHYDYDIICDGKMVQTAVVVSF